MQDGENVNRVFQDAISDDIGRPRHNHFPRATDTAHFSGIGHAAGLADGEPNALDRAQGSGGVIVRNVLEDFMELLDCWKSPP